MDRILLVVALAFIYSSPSLAASEDRAHDGFQYTLVSDHDNGYDGSQPIAWVGEYGQLADDRITIEEKSLGNRLDRSSSNPGSGLGVGVAPLFDTYGVFRTSSNLKKPAYVALGYISEEFIMDDAATSDSRDDRGFSFGFGVNESTFNFEYMMLVDQENYAVSAIGMAFTSEF